MGDEVRKVVGWHNFGSPQKSRALYYAFPTLEKITTEDTDFFDCFLDVS